ncbi:hypothetical protein GQ53DRAFT_726877 [Thozetella sp. PMI_491]|nr:hypothetical protein GQ53DRAFT_726877 [Thozetella sp. PMI_491]
MCSVSSRAPADSVQGETVSIQSIEITDLSEGGTAPTRTISTQTTEAVSVANSSFSCPSRKDDCRNGTAKEKEKFLGQPQRLGQVTFTSAGLAVIDVIVASIPLMFIVIAILSSQLNGHPVSPYGDRLMETLLLSPTIFPIVFAANMGRCFKYLGLFCAERGISLARLEQLVGSQSLFSALERLFGLKAWSITGILTTTAWLLSPLGGQAALRLLDTEPLVNITETTYEYLDPNSIHNSVFVNGTFAQGISSFSPTFYLAVSTSDGYQNTSTDMYGNVKLPSYLHSPSQADADGWKAVDEAINSTYTSLLGIPVARVSSIGNSSYSLKARYAHVDCTSNSRTGPEVGTDLRSSWGLAFRDEHCGAYPCPFSLISVASENTTSEAICSLELRYTEVLVSCDGSICQPNSSRIIPLLSDGYDAAIDNVMRGAILPNTLAQLPIVEAPSGNTQPSTAEERWIYDPYTFTSPQRDNATHVDLWKLSPETLAERLEILYNTLLQVSYANRALSGRLPLDLSTLSGSTGLQLKFDGTPANITVVISDGQYRCNWGWFVALLVSAVLLQLAACAGLVLKCMTLAPDIVGYVSSLTLFNPYIPIPTGSTALNGLDRAAALGSLRVTIGDVRGEELIGTIALVGGGLAEVSRLDRKKSYR